MRGDRRRRPCYPACVADGFLDGMTLAAVAQDDRDGTAAAPGLSPALATKLRDRLAALDALDRTRRRAELRRIAARLEEVPVDADLPARAASLLVADVPREVGMAWAARAPKVRRGFGVTPGLRSTLRRLAAPADPTAEARERSAAARVDADLPDRADALRRWARRLAGDADANASSSRVLGALALGARGEAGGDGTSRPWRRLGRALAEVWAHAREER